jgi:cytochrome c2
MRALILILPVALAACGGHEGHDRAKALIAAHCGACHVVPGISSATGRVGPSLAGIGRQQLIAGYFANSRPNMIRWVAHSRDMLPGNAMPNSGLNPDQAARVADYLYTLDE